MQLRVKELREGKGWNQTVLAYHAGISPSQISLIETGKRNPTVETLEGIAKALGVEITDLFPKAPGHTLPLEEATAGPEPLYNAYEALGRVLASDWKEELDEWNEKIPTGSAPDSFYFGMLCGWVVGIGATKSTYEAVARDAYSPHLQELQDTLRLMEDAYGEAKRKCLKVFEPAKEYADFRKIVEENNLEAILSNAVGDE